MEYYSVTEENAFESVLMRWMNREPIIWVKSEREKQILHSNAYIWNLERQYWPTYFQGSRDTDTGDRLLDTVWEGKGGASGESSVETCTPPYIECIASGNLLYEAESSNPVLWDNLNRWDGVGTYVYLCNICVCVFTNTILYSNYLPIKNKWIKKIKFTVMHFKMNWTVGYFLSTESSPCILVSGLAIWPLLTAKARSLVLNESPSPTQGAFHIPKTSTISPSFSASKSRGRFQSPFHQLRWIYCLQVYGRTIFPVMTSGCCSSWCSSVVGGLDSTSCPGLGE